MRNLVSGVLLLSFVAPLAAMAAPLRTQQIAPDFRLEQLSPNVYAFISNNTTHVWEDGNTTVVVTGTGVVVIDASTTYLSERHLAEIRKLTSQPVRYVINTHWHRDHVWGDHVYKDAFPTAQIVMQDESAHMSDLRNPGILNSFKGKDGADLVARLKKAAETGVGVAETGINEDGKKLAGADLARARRTYEEVKPVYAAEMRAGAYVPVDVTFDNRMTIKLGDEELQLMHFVGHTHGDAVVYLPKDKILITGDLVIAPVPYGINDLFDPFIDSLNTLIEMPAAAIVPGHGEVQFSKDYMKLERDLFVSLMDQARESVRNHHSLDEFKKSVNLAPFKTRLVGGDSDSQWAWDNNFYDTAVERAWTIAHGDL